MTAVVAMSKCSRTKKAFGIRFEKTGRNWTYTWAFPIQEKTAAHENYDKTQISGNLIEGENYPGCPHCKARGFFYCNCGKLNCWDCESQVVTCSWCGNTGTLEGRIDSINITGNF